MCANKALRGSRQEEAAGAKTNAASREAHSPVHAKATGKVGLTNLANFDVSLSWTRRG
jgi:hypothetical protein